MEHALAASQESKSTKDSIALCTSLSTIPAPPKDNVSNEFNNNDDDDEESTPPTIGEALLETSGVAIAWMGYPLKAFSLKEVLGVAGESFHAKL